MTVSGIHLVGKTMSAHEILATITAPPERIPGGLGILAMPPDEVLRTRLIDTLTRTLERMLSPNTMQTQTEPEDWFLQTGLVLAEDSDGHILGSGGEHWAWMVVVEVRQGTLDIDGRG